MISRFTPPSTRTLFAPWPLTLALIVVATLSAAPGEVETPAPEEAATPAASDCGFFLDYKEVDLWIFWDKYHMWDHEIGLQDPAEMEAPWGEWEYAPTAYQYADGPKHSLKRGWTLEHGEHEKCELI